MASETLNAVRRGFYLDSVALMRVARAVSDVPPHRQKLCLRCCLAPPPCNLEGDCLPVDSQPEVYGPVLKQAAELLRRFRYRNRNRHVPIVGGELCASSGQKLLLLGVADTPYGLNRETPRGPCFGEDLF